MIWTDVCYITEDKRKVFKSILLNFSLINSYIIDELCQKKRKKRTNDSQTHLFSRQFLKDYYYMIQDMWKCLQDHGSIIVRMYSGTKSSSEPCKMSATSFSCYYYISETRTTLCLLLCDQFNYHGIY